MAEQEDRKEQAYIREEQAYIQGSRMAQLAMLQHCLKELGYTDPAARQVAWITEREEAINQLRDLCRDFGDNDWPAGLHLGDVIEKHLGRHLYSKED